MKEKFLTFCISATFFIYSLVPVWLVILQGRLLGWLLHHVVRFKRKRILDNLVLVYGEEEDWPPAVLKKIYRHIGLLITEFLKMPSLKGEMYNQRFHLHGEENLTKVLEKNKGAIIVSAHTGNWEYGISGLIVKGYKASVIVKRLKGVDNDYVFEKIRGAKGVGSIFKDKAVLNIRRALKKNELVVMVIDQNSKRTEGVFVEHFGKLASTYVAPYILSSRFGTPVIPVFNYRDDNLKDHHVVFYPELPELSTGTADQDQVANTQSYVKAFEDFLLKHPEQWIWMHRRWRTQPKEES